jgi:outer membrane protein OmpA-like peptidoglycan-associated protein
MNTAKHFIIGAVLLGIITLMTGTWVDSASSRYAETAGEQAEPQAAVASATNEDYCTPKLKKVLKHVLTSCGLVKEGGRSRGCQPMEARKVAAMSGPNFNALFKNLVERAAIIQFNKAVGTLDKSAKELVETTYVTRRGASYFLVVARASPEGPVKLNRELSQQRAESVLTHLKKVFDDPELERQVGLLWLGEEFAQLEVDFCHWNRSRSGFPCNNAQLNRSAFIAWIDCRL